MSGLAVTVAVIEQGQILLIQREDFKVWALPGGKVEPGESVAQAGIREVYEYERSGPTCAKSQKRAIKYWRWEQKW